MAHTPGFAIRRRGWQAVLALLAVLAAAALAAPAGALALNPVQIENALPGSTGWNAPETTAGLLEGYADHTSALPGDTVNLKVSTTSSATYRVEIYRLGWYGGDGGRLMTCLPSCAGSKTAISQPYPTPDPTTGLVQPNWSTTDSFTVGGDWVSGYYLVLLKLTAGPSAGQSFSIPLIVRAPPSRPKVMLVQAATNTWQAYNRWGGKSLYNSNSVGQVHANMVSFDRPLHNESQSLYDYEIQFVRFTEREGYDVAYQSDYDTHADPLGLRGYKLVASVGHDEYWTKEMRDAFEGARDAGVNLAFFGANISYWQMRYADGGHTIVEYKDRSADPEPDPTLKTIQFRVLMPARPECQMIGVQYEGAISTNAYRAYTVDPSSLTDPWLAGTGFTAGATVPLIVGYEWDNVVSGCAVPGTPKVLLHYAGGTEPNADAVRYTAPSGAKVFSAGTLNWSWKLDDWSQPGEDTTGHGADPRIQALTRNVLNDLTSSTGGGGTGNLPPTASFTRNVTSPAAGDTVTFTDTSTDSDGTIAARAWDLDNDGSFNDGTGTTASRAFTSAGTYTVRLRVTDNSGDTATSSMTVAVSGAAGAWSSLQHRGSFASASATSMAIAPTAPLTTGSLVVIAVAWADQTSTVTVTDGLGNTYTPVATPARYSGSRSVQLFYARNVTGGATTITTRFSATVTNRFVGISEYAGMDPIAPLVTSANGNGGSGLSSAVPVTTTAPGQLVFAINQNGGGGITSVGGSAAALLDSGAGSSVGDAHDRAADAGTNAITFNYSSSGSWATQTAVFRARANIAPVASFTRDAEVPAVGQPVTFLDTSTDLDGTIVARAWDLDDDGSFDDGTGVTAATVFAAPGTYTVRLRVTDNGGASATASMIVTVPDPNTPPAASFTRDLAAPVAGQPVTFTDTSTDADGTIAARAWDLDNDGSFNDGTGTTASRTFASAGAYTVRLRVTDDRGAASIATASVTVLAANVPPVASFTRDVEMPRPGQTVTFTDTSTDLDGTIVARAWDLDDDGSFNDGSGATAATVFAVAGTYTVRLQVTDDDGATATTAVDVVAGEPVNSPPAASFTRDVASPITGDTVTFTDTSTDPDGTIASRAWDLDDDGQFNDGTVATASRTFTSAGTYPVRLRVTDDAEAATTATMSVVVLDPNVLPTASLTRDVAAPVAGQAVTFTDTSTDTDGSIAARAWDLDNDGLFNDGTGATASRTFATAGTSTVRLRVTDDRGGTATATMSVDVLASNVLPTPSFTRDVAAPVTGQAVTFTDTSTDSDGLIAARAWDLDDDGLFNDGADLTASRTFATAGTYIVRLRVTDDRGGVATATMSIVVLAPNVLPTASFTRSIASPVAGEAVTFTDTSSDSDGTIAARAWDLDNDGLFNDGTGTTASRTFTSGGTYTVRLRVTDDRGGTAIATMTVTVAAWANAQQRTSSKSASATTLALATTSATTAGDLVVVAVGWGSPTTTATVTDSRGNAYAAIGTPTPYATTGRIQLFYARVTTAGTTTVTARFSASSSNRFVALSEYRGVWAPAPLVAFGGANGAGTAGAATVNATAAGQLIVAADRTAAGAGISSVTGNTPTLLGTASGGRLGHAMDTALGTGAQAITFRSATSAAWASAAAVFAPAP